MSVDTPPEPERSPEPPQALRREALLPSERSRGLGTVAVVCTMAGVASGLALATTLMAMQVADSMSVRSCPYRVVNVDMQPIDQAGQHGFLGIRYFYKDGAALVDSVVGGTPAAEVGLQKGDRVLTIDGAGIHSDEDVQRLATMMPGTQPTLVVEHDGTIRTVHPTLMPFPAVISSGY